MAGEKGFFNPEAMKRMADAKLCLPADNKVGWEVEDITKVPPALTMSEVVASLVEAKINNPDHPEYRGNIPGIKITG